MLHTLDRTKMCVFSSNMDQVDSKSLERPIKCWFQISILSVIPECKKWTDHHQVRVAARDRSVALSPWPRETASLLKSTVKSVAGRAICSLEHRDDVSTYYREDGLEMRRSDNGGPDELERCPPLLRCTPRPLCVGERFALDRTDATIIILYY